MSQGAAAVNPTDQTLGAPNPEQTDLTADLAIPELEEHSPSSKRGSKSERDCCGSVMDSLW